LLILFVFSVRDGSKNFPVDVTVLFSSPSRDRWGGGKQDNETIGFGMEVPTEVEYLRIKEVLYPELSTRLCENRTVNEVIYNEIKACLRSLNLSDNPEDYERKALFGRQFRYLFGSDVDIKTALQGLEGAALDYAKKNILIPGSYQKAESVKSHKLVQLNFDLNARVFRHRFVSNLVLHLAIKKLKVLKKEKAREQLNLLKDNNQILYGDAIETQILREVNDGTPFYYRRLGENGPDFQNSFESSRLVFFSCVDHPPIQMWYRDMKTDRMLGCTRIADDILYCPTDKTCCTVDAILLQKREIEEEQVIIVNFIQATVQKNHGVSPAGFFAMFMLVKLLKYANGCEAIVRFWFAVTEEVYDIFNSFEADYLRSLFDKIGIFVMKIKEGGSSLEVVNKTNKKSGGLSSSGTDQEMSSSSQAGQDELFLPRKKTIKIEQNLNSQLIGKEEPSMGYVPLLLEVSNFKDVRLTLNWSDNIRCVIDDGMVSVNVLDERNDNTEHNVLNYFENLDDSEDFEGFEDSEDPEEIGGSGDKDTDHVGGRGGSSSSAPQDNIEDSGDFEGDDVKTLASSSQGGGRGSSSSDFERNNRRGRGRKRGRRKRGLSSSVLGDNTKEIIQIYGYVSEAKYFDEIDVFFHRYLKICTLFYKRSFRNRSNGWKRSMGTPILRLLSEHGNNIFNDTSNNTCEIRFSSLFDRNDIIILVGCLNLCLLNFGIQSLNNLSNVKLKFYPNVFLEQTSFLRRIQERLSFEEININLQQQ
jgi:hypothetical protein